MNAKLNLYRKFVEEELITLEPLLLNHHYDELYNKLAELIINYKNLRNSSSKYRKLVNRFNWEIMKNKYDELFESICNKNI